MSQGDPTFNATSDIRILLRELSLCRERWTGYTDDDMHVIIRTIGYLRTGADKEEEARGWEGKAQDGGSSQEEALDELKTWGLVGHGPFTSFNQPIYPYQHPQPWQYPPATSGLSGLKFSGD